MRIGAFEMNEPVPELKEPYALAMLRPWVDVGSVGSLVLRVLEGHFGAKEAGKLARPGSFFDFTRYRPTIALHEGRREVTVPNTFINYAQRLDGHDLLFLHMLEPHMFAEDYIESIAEVLKAFGTKRYALIGSMYDAVPHTRPLLVTGTMAGQDRVQPSTYQGPTSVTFMLNQKAPELGMETGGLVVHLPQYVQLEEDYSGMARVLEVLQSTYDLPDHLIDYQKGEAQYQEISRAMTRNSRLRPVIQQLEADYDARIAGPPQQEPLPPLSPKVEDFLREMDERFQGS